MIRKLVNIVPNSQKAFLKASNNVTKTPLTRPLKTSYGSELFIKDGISYEKQILADGRIKMINLDTGDEIIGTALSY